MNPVDAMSCQFSVNQLFVWLASPLDTIPLYACVLWREEAKLEQPQQLEEESPLSNSKRIIHCTTHQQKHNPVEVFHFEWLSLNPWDLSSARIDVSRQNMEVGISRRLASHNLMVISQPAIRYCFLPQITQKSSSLCESKVIDKRPIIVTTVYIHFLHLVMREGTTRQAQPVERLSPCIPVVHSMPMISLNSYPD